MAPDEPKSNLPDFLKPKEEQAPDEPEIREAPETRESLIFQQEAMRELYGKPEAEPAEGKEDRRSEAGERVWEGHTKGEKPKKGMPHGGSVVKKEGKSWGDHMLAEAEDLSFKHETLAHMAASGMTNNKIAAELGLTPTRISVLLSNTLVKKRVAAIQAIYWGGSIEKRFKQSVPKAMDVVDKAISNEDGTHKPADQLKAATWLLEKVTGKAAQEIDHKSNSIRDLFSKVDEMINKGEIIDVSPRLPEREEGPTVEEVKQQSRDEQFDDWIAGNLGDGE